MSAAQRWVVDASLSLSWIHPGQATKETDDLLESLKQGVELVVPGLWFLEMANALLVLERRGKLTGEERQEALFALRAFPITVDMDGHCKAFGEISKIATECGLSIYDATYLELARREHLPLGTKDSELRVAAGKCAVKLLL